MKIYIGADHAGFEMKETLKKYLVDLGYEVEDKGAFKHQPDDDYPDFVRPVAEAVAEGFEHSRETVDEVRGIIIGGSGQAEAMVANRIKGVRAAVFYGVSYPKAAIDIEGKKSSDSLEIIKLSRAHNNANILSLAARFIDDELAKKAVVLWLETSFDGGRHERRIAKIDSNG